MERPNNPNETKYLLIGEEEFERLLRSYYILGKGLLAFEYLCGHSDRPMYLSAEGVCEVLGITRDELEAHYMAGGHVEKVVHALVSASKANIDLSFQMATGIDLAGRDVFEAVQMSVNPKVIDTPPVTAVAKDGIQRLLVG